MHDKFKRRMQSSKGTDRLRQQIAVEAARRMLETLGPVPDDPSGRIGEATESEYYTAKRKAAAVLGHRIRPGDLPSDSEIRAEVLSLCAVTPEPRRARGSATRADRPAPHARGSPGSICPLPAPSCPPGVSQAESEGSSGGRRTLPRTPGVRAGA